MVQNDIEIDPQDMGERPGARQVNREKRLSEIIRASIKVFADEGYAGFSMRKVAAAAGVRLNTVQHYFGDLKSLLLATIAAAMQTYDDRYRQLALNRQMLPQDRLEVLLDDIFAEIRKPEVGAFFFEVWALARHDPAVAALLETAYAAYRGTFAGIAREIKPSLTEMEAEVIGAMMGSWTEGLLVMWRYGGPGAPTMGAIGLRMKVVCKSLFGAASRAAAKP